MSTPTTTFTAPFCIKNRKRTANYWCVDENGNITTGFSPVSTVITITSDYTALTTDEVIFINATNNNITVVLYPTIGNTGRNLTIKRIDSSANVVTINGTIDGVLNNIMISLESLTLMPNQNNNWSVL